MGGFVRKHHSDAMDELLHFKRCWGKVYFPSPSAAVGTRGYLRCVDSFTGIFCVAGLGDVLVLACHCSGGSWLWHPGALTLQGVLQC